MFRKLLDKVGILVEYYYIFVTVVLSLSDLFLEIAICGFIFASMSIIWRMTDVQMTLPVYRHLYSEIAICGFIFASMPIIRRMTDIQMTLPS